MNAIQIKNITKRYKDVTALDDVSFSFEFGKIYGFLGRNGAGKTTLINIIANRIFADQGEILIDGIPAKENMGVHEKIFCMFFWLFLVSFLVFSFISSFLMILSLVL